MGAASRAGKLSRVAHFRRDFPETSAAFQHSLISVSQEQVAPGKASEGPVSQSQASQNCAPQDQAAEGQAAQAVIAC